MNPILTNQATHLLRRSGAHCFKTSAAASLRLSSSLSSSTARTSTLQTSFRRSPVQPRVVAGRHAFSSTSTVLFSSTSAVMGGNVQLITTKGDFEAKVLNGEGVVIVDAFAEWCGPCKAIAPKVDAFSEQYPNAKFYKIDVDELSDVAAELGIRAMPTFLIFVNGEKVQEVVGANPPALEAGIKQHL